MPTLHHSPRVRQYCRWAAARRTAHRVMAKKKRKGSDNVSFPSRQATTGASGWLDHAQTSGGAPALCVPALFVLTPPFSWPVKMAIRLAAGHQGPRGRVSSAVNGKQPCEEELNTLSATRPAGWKPPAGQVEARLVRPAWSQQRDQPVVGGSCAMCTGFTPHSPITLFESDLVSGC
ncbi:hypothetical protein HaLaN_08025 [Haematococcus lacustris]|uniref:Uncharacterized protein n=1 Tax=Haematococcus lacustris TaxID=44745 RepID=A0A699YPX6_HAELA|nr:hypothetical protein HaLaN_08025 [Haematococcus lacustris]